MTRLLVKDRRVGQTYELLLRAMPAAEMLFYLAERYPHLRLVRVLRSGPSRPGHEHTYDNGVWRVRPRQPHVNV